ncbi:MAG: tRNA pseudouridine(55) synthase TruB [Spirochaeta sp.]|nr:tRNA pseudouridine(55) synthase TruB [Spirochaeta sp.]
MDCSIDGLVLLAKPEGITSFQALGTLKHKLHIGRIGHTGTLDKFAVGLLLVLTGSMTRLSPLFMSLDKIYRAVIIFGKETDTLDPEGDITLEREIPGLTAVQQAIESQIGEIEQIPPVYSAIHINGSRAYQLARSGNTPQLEPRQVRIDYIKLIAYKPPKLSIEVKCSKGTYIRSLARDLGRLASSCAHVSRLERTSVGNFYLKNAVTPESFNPESDIIPPIKFLKVFSEIRQITVSNLLGSKIINGQSLDDKQLSAAVQLSDGLYALFGENEKLLAIASRKNGEFSYQGVFSTKS